MTDAPGGNGDGPPDRSSATADVHANAWQETLSDLWALADSYEGKGWETVATAADDTGALAPGHREGYWGLVHVVPDSDAAAISEAVEGATFPAYNVHRAAIEGRLFAVTSLLDPGERIAVLIAHQFPLREATELVAHTREVDIVNTVVRYLDGTVVAQFEHAEPEKFFPQYGEFEEFAAGWTQRDDRQ
jgi:hypothetical protein